MSNSSVPQSIARIGVDCREELREQRYALIPAGNLRLSAELQDAFAEMAASWDRLDADPHFGGGDRATRTRRYSDFDYVPATGELTPRSHVAYLQSEEMNSFVGGLERHFGDVEPAIVENPLFKALVEFDFDSLPIEEEYRSRKWICQIHQIRIVVNPGRTYEVVPEGIHSDGYPFAGLHLIGRTDIDGGESTVFTWEEEPLAKATFLDPLDTLIFEDRKMKHHVTPISAPADRKGQRDVLAISFSLPGSPYETVV
ncbi:2OG-Fe dioxygenase family protein [Streptomyces sp. URMC 127]|uniref:2OG-Fe dioxygenase family protein n=1 Tax=Streptomyces sp. URMC 127 TaxID=3423402 RepID=UPI003F1C6A4D